MKQGKLSSLSIVLPAFNDSLSLPGLLKKIHSITSRFTDNYEIIVVNDGSTDDTKRVLNNLKKDAQNLKIITHPKNQGYGAALAKGFKHVSKDYIFYTDSDGQYDVTELAKLVSAMNPKIDVVTGYKAGRVDPWYRKLVGLIYNRFVKALFRLKVKDVDCDFRLFRRSIVQNADFKVKSGAFDVEFMLFLQNKNARIKEVPVHHFKRQYGSSQFFHAPNILSSLIDVGMIFLRKYS